MISTAATVITRYLFFFTSTPPNSAFAIRLMSLL
jgi:hypothetical protein